MGIFSFIKKKSKDHLLYSEKTRELNLKGLESSLPENYSGIKLGLGKLKINENLVEISESIRMFDANQASIMADLDNIKDSNLRDEQLKKVIDIKLEIMKLAQQAYSEKKNNNLKNDNILSTIDKKGNPYEALRCAGHIISNLQEEDLQREGLIIWPVALKKKLSLIHKAQIEILKVLQNYNWSIQIIIADCGKPSDYNIPEFKKRMKRHLQSREIDCSKIEILSKYFQHDYSDRGDILTKFVDISNSLKINELSSFNKKDDTYDDQVKKEIETRSVLKYIQPVLTWSVVLHLAENYSNSNPNNKALVIAGQDEESQWTHVFDKISTKIGAIFNPILRTQDNGVAYTASQEKLIKNFYSEDSLVKQLNNGNISKWLFNSFIQLPIYPGKIKLKDLDFCDRECKKDEDCLKCLFPDEKSESLPDFVDKEKFVKKFWKIINPA
ncbi:hypothetical protein [Marinifilum fragile]|uniref:hypothetical protein n=1 Tax=Marinifilum fragile TaxID=570161 RepID=UPI002AA6FEE6|nr:hypothetical protein [Marinifilum fragile]